MTRTQAGLFAVAMLSLATPGAAQGQVWVVAPAPGPGVDFTDLASAITSAADGDAILVEPGTYGSSVDLVVSAKSLVLAADVGGDVTVGRELRVENLAAGQAVVVRGIDFHVSTPPLIFTATCVLSLSVNQGALWFEDVAASSDYTWPRNGVDAKQCAALSFQRCSLVGSDLFATFSVLEAPDGIHALSSNLALYGCEAIGGDAGFSAFGIPGSHGGHGVRTTDGFLFAGGSRLVGGAGGFAAPRGIVPCPTTGNGGDGLFVASAGAQAWSQASVFLGGTQGGGSACPGLPGQPIDAPAGTYAALPGGRHSFSASSPVREGQSTLLAFGGQPGELIFAGYSAQPGFAFLPAFGGVLLLGAPLSIAAVGAIPPSGADIALAVPIGELGPGVEFARLYLQAAALDPSTLAVSLGGASSVLLLDAAF